MLGETQTRIFNIEEVHQIEQRLREIAEKEAALIAELEHRGIDVDEELSS